MQQTYFTMRLLTLTIPFLFLTASETAPKQLPSPLFQEGIRCYYHEIPVKGKQRRPAYVEEVTRNTIEKLDMIPKRLTVFLLHGFADGQNSLYIKNVRDAYIRMCGNCNIMTVKWNFGSTKYNEVAKRVPIKSRAFATGLNTIVKYGFMRKPFTFIGMGLGAHLAGIATQNLSEKPVHVVGLDPAGPGFKNTNEKQRISRLSAKTVEIIYTDLKHGLSNDSLGHLNFYVNGGFSQPSCKDEYCSHLRSAEVYAEAVVRPRSVVGVLCQGWKHFLDKRCDNEVALMGTIYPGAVNFSHGDYFLRTQDRQPYGLGMSGLKPQDKAPETAGFMGRIWNFIRNIFG